jgi:hypothetical protein
MDECGAAAAQIDNGDTSTTDDKIRIISGPRPEGCYVEDGVLWLGSQPSNVGNGAYSSRFPICRRGKLVLP